MNKKIECTLCTRPIDPKDFELRGNFCSTCSSACEKLSKMFPTKCPELPIKPDILLEPMKETNETMYKLCTASYNKKLEKYQEALNRHNYQTRKYENETKEFQNNLLELKEQYGNINTEHKKM